MDGAFVSTKSFPPVELNHLKTSLPFELHLMVQDPAQLISLIENPALKQVIFHYELDIDRVALGRQLHERGISAGLAIRPDTEISSFRNSADMFDTLLLLTVDPCCYGNPLKPEVLRKVELSRGLFPEKAIAVDGGVSLENLEFFYQSGVDYVCVGSRIFLDGVSDKDPSKRSPTDNYRAFVQKVHELELKNPKPSKRT
jgi:ribulose-phosphate 3-epimerase